MSIEPTGPVVTCARDTCLTFVERLPGKKGGPCTYRQERGTGPEDLYTKPTETDEAPVWILVELHDVVEEQRWERFAPEEWFCCGPCAREHVAELTRVAMATLDEVCQLGRDPRRPLGLCHRRMVFRIVAASVSLHDTFHRAERAEASPRDVVGWRLGDEAQPLMHPITSADVERHGRRKRKP